MSKLLESVKKIVKKKNEKSGWKNYKKVTMPNGSKGWTMRAKKAREFRMKTFEEFLTEGPRIRRIRVRIRGGKIQRNVKKSGVKGYTLRGGHLVRMSIQERLHRKRGARRGKIKRRAKMARILMKRRRSLRRLKSMGGMRR